MNCGWVKSRIALYLYQELDDAERVELEQHAGRCPQCAAELEQERRLHQVWDARRQPAVDPNVLAACRLRLSEALETEPRPGFGWLRLRSWLTVLVAGARMGVAPPRLRPVMAALMVVVAFAGGWTVSRWRGPSGSLPAILQPREEVNEANISNIASINAGANGQLEIVYDTTRQRILRGSPDDPRIQQFLVYATRSYSNAGIRLDSIELLKNRAGDREIRQALIAALRSDHNPGVRLKALDALKGMVAEEPVRQALLDVLRGDQDAGMRIEAINQLSKLRDAATLPLLQQLAIGDPNNLVRLRSASALKAMNAPEVF
jgi:hypothetical protein